MTLKDIIENVLKINRCSNWVRYIEGLLYAVNDREKSIYAVAGVNLLLLTEGNCNNVHIMEVQLALKEIVKVEKVPDMAER